MKSKFLKAAFAVVSACTLMACTPEKESNAAQGPSASSGTLQTQQTAPATESAQPEKDMNKLTLTAEWDKVFPKSDKVEHSKVTFKNHFGIELAADMFVPKDTSLKVNGKFPAIAVSGPFGAVKEQSSGLYAQQMAERGFLTIAFDPSFTGESGGEPRYMNSPDINTEDFMASVDFLSTRDNVDPERIGIIGICGWGGMAINAAGIDTRVKATVASTMYDMSRVSANGYFDSANNADARNEARKALMAQRTKDFKNGTYDLAGGVIDPLPDDAPYFVKDYYAYYKTPRGYHKRSLNSNKGWAASAGTSLMNTKLLAYADEIRNPVLIIHGEKAHSRYFGEGAFEKMTGKKANVPAKLDATKNWSKTVGNKELLVIPGASHVDLYDNLEKIPFEKLNEFFKTNLK
ncbi:MAG: alpha/beta hydrolase [Fibrobacter sp.]|uniref:alpha/beta hydrolase n=1 Tax=Fibrobacter sp. TaxID=35828 RepID=UPI001AFFAF9A|nr:alpha/beta hydrolase [Fibrobacter sp.]MBO7060403.1 alpha/beta hydrolase [Fibrobacter sp.]